MNNIKSKNIYTIVDFPKDGETYGNFVSDIPKKAASKAFSALMQFIDVDKSNEDFFLGKFVVFVIKNKSNGKIYKYIGNRIKLKNSIKVMKNSQEIEYKYKNVIGKYREELNLIK